MRKMQFSSRSLVFILFYIIILFIVGQFFTINCVHAEEYDYEITMRPESGDSLDLNYFSGEIVSSDESLVDAQFSNRGISFYSYCKLGSAIVTLKKDGEKTIKIKVNVVDDFTISPKEIVVDSSYEKYSGAILYSPLGSEAGDYKYVIYPMSDTPTPFYNIEKAYSQNTAVARLKNPELEDSYNVLYRIVPTGVGTTNIVCVDYYGQKALCKIIVKPSYMTGYIKANTSIGNPKYGESSQGRTFPGALVSVKMDGKVYSSKANSKGLFSVKLPKKKIGTVVEYNISYHGGKCVLKRRVIKSNTTVSFSETYRKTKRMTIKASNVHKSDRIIVKVGKKTYCKTIQKDGKQFSYQIKLKSKKKAGTRIIVTIRNIDNQVLCEDKDMVYYASDIKKGMKKKYIKWIPYWNDHHETYVSGKYVTWWYEDNSYLTFYKGKLIGWHV